MAAVSEPVRRFLKTWRETRSRQVGDWAPVKKHPPGRNPTWRVFAPALVLEEEQCTGGGCNVQAWLFLTSSFTDDCLKSFFFFQNIVVPARPAWG